MANHQWEVHRAWLVARDAEHRTIGVLCHALLLLKLKLFKVFFKVLDNHSRALDVL